MQEAAMIFYDFSTITILQMVKSLGSLLNPK